MHALQPQRPAASTVQSRLQQARHAGFVGRAEERAAFAELLGVAAPRQSLVYVYGPPGIGKTSLLHEYAYMAIEAGRATYPLDLHDAEPSVAAVLRHIAAHAPFHYDEAEARIEATDQHFVLLLDTCETIGDEALAQVLRQLLRALPDGELVVAAGREPLSVGFRTDSGWRSLMQVHRLGVLDAGDSRALLDGRAVPADAQPEMLDFAGGYPLALTLVAEAFEAGGVAPFEPGAAPSVTAALLDRFLSGLPDARQRTALYAISLPPVTDEPLLAAMLEEEDVYGLFEWLRERTFVESTARGLHPHELVRNALAADLRWRNPALLDALHQRARQHYAAALAAPTAPHARLLADYLFLFRDNPLVRPLLARLREQWAGRSLLQSATLSEQQRETVRGLVERHEGAAAAARAEAWMQEQPGSVHVYHDDDGGVAGCLFALRFGREALEAARHDPALDGAARFLDLHTPLRAGETALYFRFWMARDEYHNLSPAQCMIFADTVRHYLTTPGLAFSFLPCTNPDFWGGIFQFVGLRACPEARFSEGDKTFHVFGVDWRALPPARWLNGVASLGLEATQPPPEAQRQPYAVLSRDAFEGAVRDVLRHFHQPELLRQNPLVSTRLLSGHADAGAAIAALRALVESWADGLSASPREARAAAALRATYLEPAPTQEQAAEQLDLPFSTYRRHLKAGIDLLTDLLWARELAGQAL